MKRILLLIAVLTTNTFCFAQQLQINHQPIIWLSADKAGNTNNRWDDISGSQYHAYTASGQSLPNQGWFNFNKCFVFDSSTQALRINYMPGSTENNCIFTVYHTHDTTTELGLWYLFPDTAKYCFLTTRNVKSTGTRVKYSDSTFTRAIINTSMQKWKNIHVDSLNSYMLLGGTDSLSYRGKLAEFMMFNTTLKGKELIKVHTYLAIKYGISLFESNYIGSNDSILWNYKENKTFDKEIAGIGKDTLLNIIQTQSAAQGGNNIITIAANKLALTNELNTTNINQGDFLIWSSNNGNINSIVADTLPATSINNLTEKKWIIQRSGNTAFDIPTQVIFDASQLDSVGRCLLLINRPADGVFNNAATEIYQPDSSDTQLKFYFSNIKWDTDSSGKDIFTFLTGTKLTLLASTANNANNNPASSNYSAKLDVLTGSSPFIFSVIPDSLPNNINTWTSSDSMQYLYGLATGKYTAIVTDVKGAKDTAVLEIPTAPNVEYSQLINNGSASNTFTENKLLVYPNPADKYFIITIQLLQKETVVLTYRDIQGRVIFEKTLSGANSYFLYEDGLKEKGSYIIEIKTNTANKTVKLVVN
jgi:hypothetical protein